MTDQVKPHGCHNRERKAAYVAFDGYTDASRRQVVTTLVPDRMSPDCQYSKHTDDPRCAGCRHKQSPQ